MLLLHLLIFWLSSLIQSAQVPKQIHILFRHGERSPTTTYKNDPHKNHRWDGGLGQLTNRGKQQMYALGQNFRNYYKNVLPKLYWPLEVNFTSSYAERCLMSAELFAAGLFPPKDEQVWNPDLLWQPIPIHYLPRKLDNFIAMKSNCTRYDEEFAEVQKSSRVKQYNKEYRNLYQFLTEHTGQLVDNIEAVESLYNTLEIYQMNNLSLPYWINGTLMAKMRLIAAQNLAIYSKTNYMKKMKGGFFLKRIIDLMEGASQGRKDIPSFNAYAGHDLTIIHVMRALNVVDIMKPEFGASLVFEVYDGSIIKIFYWHSWRGNSKEQLLINCPNPCTIDRFKERYQDVLPTNWEEECQY